MNSGKKVDVEDRVADPDWSSVVARWARIESELDDVQKYIGREQRSIERRISKWAGIAALLISIVVGGFAIFDNIFLSPKQRQAQDLAQLRDIVRQIGRVNLDVAFRWTPGNESMNANLGLVSNSIKLPLMSSAVEIIEKHTEDVPVFAFMAIIPELSQAQDYDRAIKFGKRARERARGKEANIAASAEFTRLIAGAHMAKGNNEDRENARRYYIESIEEARTLGAFVQSWIVSQTIRDWSIWEAAHGNCAGSIEIFERFATDIDRRAGRAARCTGVRNTIGPLTQSCPVAGHDSILSMKRECGIP